MFRYKLRTLLIVLVLGPPVLFVLALVWLAIMVHMTSYPPRVKVYNDPNGKTGLRTIFEQSTVRTPVSPTRRAEVRAEIAKIETNPGTWKPRADAKDAWEALERERERYLE
jgi:hypothetical protein